MSARTRAAVCPEGKDRNRLRALGDTRQLVNPKEIGQLIALTKDDLLAAEANAPIWDYTSGRPFPRPGSPERPEPTTYEKVTWNDIGRSTRPAFRSTLSDYAPTRAQSRFLSSIDDEAPTNADPAAPPAVIEPGAKRRYDLDDE